MAFAAGIDVSSYQSATPDVSGLDFAFVKITEGINYVNPEWVTQRATIKGAGLVFGAYHFARCADGWQANADWFLNQINVAPGDVIALDWEPYDQLSQGPTALTAWKDQWLAYVKAQLPNNQVGLYCDRNTWLNVDVSSDCGDFLWIADYVTEGSPRIQHPWTFHQYTDTPQDQDAYNGTADQLRAWAGLTASAGAAPAAVPTAPPVQGPTATPAPATPQWRTLLDHVLAVPEQVYETWVPATGWDNHTPFGVEYGEDGVPWCAIFNVDMYHDVGLDAVVPRTDNVTDFTNWAQAHGQWSEYPSVGAWVNFDAGGHTEIVTGFDGTYVYTKGGNSIQAGSTDGGQGNGVWSHREVRTATRVTGYFAPRFADGICPPTADPQDPRGGAAVASWMPDTPAPPPDPNAFPGAGAVGPGARNDNVTRLGQMLVARGGARFYKVGPGPQFGPADQAATKAFQEAQGWSGSDADGIPGPETWALLVTGGGHDIPPAPASPPFPGAQFFAPGQVNDYVTQLGRQLVAKGFGSHYRVGPGPSWGPADQANVRDFQRSRPDLAGDADGIPGPKTWADLFS